MLALLALPGVPASVLLFHVLFARVAGSGLRVKVFAAEIGSLNFVHPVLALAEFTQPFHLELPESRRQGFIHHVGPRSAVSRRPEPVATMQIVVAAADEKDVIGNPDSHINSRI